MIKEITHEELVVRKSMAYCHERCFCEKTRTEVLEERQYSKHSHQPTKKSVVIFGLPASEKLTMEKHKVVPDS